MEFSLSVITGGLFAAGVYLILRRSVVKLMLGVLFLSHAVNLTIFTASRIVRSEAPIIPETADALVPPQAFADPLPQAFILTAIVIGFGVQAFFLILIHRVYRSVNTDDVDEMRGIG